MTNAHVLHPRTVRFAERACGRDAIQRILAVVDLNATVHPSIEKAALLAAAFGATLELYACDEAESLPASWAGGTTLAQYRSVVRERRLGMLDELAATCRTSGLNVSVAYDCQTPIEQGLVPYAIRADASLVVKDACRHRGELPSFGGGVDCALIRKLPMPLLLVRPAPWSAPLRIAASVDPCHGAERPAELDESVAGLGGSIGRALGGVSYAIHVLESPAHLRGEIVPEDVRQAAFERQRAEVLALVCRASLEDREVRFVEQRVPDGIVQLARETRPSILVMGVAARQRPGAGGGGTACEVIDGIECDLLVVKPAGFVSPVLVTE